MTDPAAGLRIREAVRALVVDTDQRALLVRFEFPTATRWALPGGGLEPGESHLAALHRELEEEVGLVDVIVGPQIWHRLHIVPFINGAFDGQRERIFLVRTEPFDPEPRLSWEQMNAEFVHELRWWTLDEIAASDAHFVPQELHMLMTALLRDGPPTDSIDVSV
ncbi:MAG TPA: NUDIX domain-containing protein [Ilumatobacteraceae bacterium]|jgi:8-oxo-dGTP pyrophosphatase MutT (NUDIX family)|nr:NUDIX domain-containing protein [Ilumatobacteraceae bacterium]